MKRCPQCGREYDLTMSFCLDDGSELLYGPASSSRSESPASGVPTGASPSGLPSAGGQLDEPPTAIIATAGSKPRTETFLSSDRPVESTFNSVAVLPFAHLSSDPDDEYFCDGLAEELTNALGKLDDVKVVGRTSAFAFRGKDLGVSQIARILGVDHVVEGSVRKYGERMRITVQLVNAADRFQVWSEKYDAEMRDLFDVQDKITLSVVSALKNKFQQSSASLGEKAAELIEEFRHHASSVEAYQIYLRGRFYFNKLTPEGFYLALDCFRKALEIDPGFAAAHAGIADAHVFSAELGPVPPREAMPKAKQAALDALAIDPSNAEAHATLAFILQEFDFDFAGSEVEYRKAIELNPNSPVAHQYYGALLSQLSRPAEAEREFRRANELDPLSPSSNWVYPLGLFFAGRYDESIKRTRRLLELDPNFPAAHLVASFSYQMKEDHDSFVDSYTRFLDLCGVGELASIGRRSFESGGWIAFLRAMTSPEARPLITSYITAVFYEALGEHEPALAMLEDSLEKREGHMVMLDVDPRFAALRDDGRFRDILRRVGFPDKQDHK